MPARTRNPSRPKTKSNNDAPPVAPSVYGATDMDYNQYLKVPELLRLQVPLSKPAHHDEMLFIIIHQAFELWFKLLIHEIESAIRLLQGAHLRRATHGLHRVGQILRLFVRQIHLLETMRPAEFLEFRDHLKPASGFQSLQFRELEFLTGLKDEAYLNFFRNRPEVLEKLRKRLAQPDLRSALYEALRAQGVHVPVDAAERERAGDEAVRREVALALVPIYERPQDHADLYALCEALLEIDEQFQFWREHHVRVVERIIGFKRGTGGSSGVHYLRTTLSKKAFPALWDVRTHLGGGA